MFPFLLQYYFIDALNICNVRDQLLVHQDKGLASSNAYIDNTRGIFDSRL